MTLTQLLTAVFQNTVTDVLEEREARIKGDIDNQPASQTETYTVQQEQQPEE